MSDKQDKKITGLPTEQPLIFGPSQTREEIRAQQREEKRAARVAAREEWRAEWKKRKDQPREKRPELVVFGVALAVILLGLVVALAVQSRRDARAALFERDETIGSYFVDKYFGVNVEIVYLLLLDNKYAVIDCIKIHEGSVNSAAITLRRLVEIALLRNASMVVLAHNHPSGLTIPSPDDLYTTKEIKRAFDLLDIKMLGHILVAGESYINIM